MKPFRGKRTEPKSRPGDSTRGARPGAGPRTRTGRGAPPAGRAPGRTFPGRAPGPAGRGRKAGGRQAREGGPPSPGPPPGRGPPRPPSGARARAGEPRTDGGGTAPTQCPAKPRAAFARRVAPGQGAERRRRASRPPVRPVLKHGPRSLANARVAGRARTPRAQ